MTESIGRFRTFQNLSKDLDSHLLARWTLGRGGGARAMTALHSDIPWVLLYSALFTVLVLAWAYVPA